MGIELGSVRLTAHPHDGDVFIHIRAHDWNSVNWDPSVRTLEADYPNTDYDGRLVAGPWRRVGDDGRVDLTKEEVEMFPTEKSDTARLLDVLLHAGIETASQIAWGS